VDDTLRALPSFPTLEPVRAAILASLSITDELFRARQEVDRLRAEIEQKTAELTALLEEAQTPG
jgi:cell division protein ZapA (FtsZ GTPase activity inhibitor)